MILVADTHAFFWWMTRSKRLSNDAARALNRASRAGRVHVSAISLFEIGVLARTSTIKLNVPIGQWLDAVCSLPEVEIEPVGREIAQIASGISESAHGDPADRIIVATALHLGATIVTADGQMHLGQVPTIW